TVAPAATAVAAPAATAATPAAAVTAAAAMTAMSSPAVVLLRKGIDVRLPVDRPIDVLPLRHGAAARHRHQEHQIVHSVFLRQVRVPCPLHMQSCQALKPDPRGVGTTKANSMPG